MPKFALFGAHSEVNFSIRSSNISFVWVEVSKQNFSGHVHFSEDKSGFPLRLSSKFLRVLMVIFDISPLMGNINILTQIAMSRWSEVPWETLR